MNQAVLRNNFFQKIQASDISKIDFGLFQERTVAAGEIIVREGAPGEELFLLIEGEVGIRKKFSSGQEIEISRIGEGDFFGEMAIIEGRERSASVIALTSCRLAVVGRDDFFAIVSSFPRLINNIAGVMANRLRQSDQVRTAVAERNRELIRLNEEINAGKRELEAQKIQLELLNQTKDRFFTIISHDLKTPVTTIGGLSALLSESAATISPEQIREYTEVISGVTLELSRLFDNLLQWAMAQTGSLRFVPEETDIRKLTADSFKLLLADAETKKIRLTADIGEEIVFPVDRNMISTVIRNVTSNALKFTPRGGEVTLKAGKLDGGIEFSVKDTGIGIKKDHVENLFKLDGVLSRKGTEGETGSGLGLTLSKEFVEIHGGRIWVDSEEGRGTTVTFFLPGGQNRR